MEPVLPNTAFIYPWIELGAWSSLDELMTVPPFNKCRCHVLDEIGDTSSVEERRRCFLEMDVDNSDGVDFGEFLEVYVYLNYVNYLLTHCFNSLYV